MAQSGPFSEQVRLLVEVLPHVARQECFALKGGTAINLFVRDMPRLSVDIDLAYQPVEERGASLAGIDKAMAEIARDIRHALPRARVHESILAGTKQRIKLVVSRDGASIKIEVTPVLRGSVFPPAPAELSARAQAEYGFARIPVLSFEDLYAGKLCAALDRQHPRDLFDVRLLLAIEGITARLKDAFLVYLLSHHRPIAELLAPVRKDIKLLYETEFSGMAIEPVSLEALLDAREEMVAAIHEALTEQDRQFLLSVKRGDADWDRFGTPDARHLPAVRWKVHNLAQMAAAKCQEALAALERALYG
jgi:predicted nucleotidyltransferase component of viral defense system